MYKNSYIVLARPLLHFGQVYKNIFFISARSQCFISARCIKIVSFVSARSLLRPGIDRGPGPGPGEGRGPAFSRPPAPAPGNSRRFAGAGRRGRSPDHIARPSYIARPPKHYNSRNGAILIRGTTETSILRFLWFA